MKKGLIFGLGMVIGGGIGSYATYIFLNKKITNREEKLRDKEISEIRTYYENKYKKTVIKADNELKERKEEAATVKENDPPRPKKVDYRSYSPYKNLVDNSHPTDGDSDEDIREEDLEGEQAALNFSRREAFKKGIELINEEDYISRNGYDKKDLFYYEGNELIVDEDDQLMDGYIDEIGIEWTDILEEIPGRVCYVRNNKNGTDYMITCVSGDYVYE